MKKALFTYTAIMAFGLLTVLAGCTQQTQETPAAPEGTDTPQQQPAPAQETPAATPPAASETAPAATETPAEPAPAAAAGETMFKIDPAESSLKFVGSKGKFGIVVESHPGGWSEYEGTVTLAGDDITTAKVKLTIDMKSIYSDDKDLTNKLVNEPGFFEVAKFPTASFETTSIKKTDSGYEVTGDLDLHGIKKTVTFPATIELSGDELTAEAEFKVNRQDWQISYVQGIEGAADTFIMDEVPISFFIVAKKSA